MKRIIGLLLSLIIIATQISGLAYFPDPYNWAYENTAPDVDLMGVVSYEDLKNVKLVPKLYVDNSVLNYIIVSFDNFSTNITNPEFRDNIVEFDIICHFDQWQLSDFQLRPYRIAAEIDSMFNEQRLTGIGKVEFLGANQIILTDEYAGFCLMYQVVHGEEDKKKMPNPNNEQAMIDNFN